MTITNNTGDHMNSSRTKLRARRAGQALALAVIIGGASVAFAQAIPRPGSVRWPNSGGTLTVQAWPPTIKLNNGQPSTGATTSVAFTGDTKALLGSANVNFGPYKIVLQNIGVAPLYLNAPVSHTYKVTVWGSNPGQVAGGNPLAFTKLGEVSKQLTAPFSKTVTDSITVPVVMPSVFTDIKIIAEFSPGPFGRPDAYQFPRVAQYPNNTTCGRITPGLSSLEDTCLQAAVNPTGVLVPDVMPISIVYEPPGNCSYSNMVFSSQMGSSMSMTQANSTATNVIWNYSAAAGLFSGSSNTTQTNVNASSATVAFTSTSTQAFGTAFGLPLASPGNPACNAGQPMGNTSATNGPGVGDAFVFVVQPTFLYWDTAGLTNFRLSTSQAPGTTETLTAAFVRQIDPARPSMRPSFLSKMTATQLKALRGLDPFAASHTDPIPTAQPSQPMACSSGASLSPNRYVFVGRRCVGAGVPYQALRGTSYDTEIASNLTTGLASIKSSTTSESKNVSLLVGGVAAAITLVAGGGAAAFENFNKASSAYDKYVMHDSTVTTVNENLTNNSILLNSTNRTYRQEYFVRDQNREVSFDTYYDTFFGTFAFNQVSSCTAPRMGSCFNTKFGPWVQAWNGPFYGSRGTFLGDVDKDGKKDMIGLGDGYIGVIRSTGTTFGGYEEWLRGASFFGSHGTLVGDIDGDGRADLVALNDGNVTARRSTGKAPFGPVETWWPGAFYGSHGTFLADVDGDGRSDLVGIGDGYVGVIRAQANNTFGQYETWLTGNFFGSYGTYVADVDGDGLADLVGLGNGYVGVMHSSGSSAQGFVSYETWMYSTFAGSHGTLVDDVNGDGRADLVALNDNAVVVATSAGNTFAAPYSWWSGGFYGSVGPLTLIGDMTGDGRADLVDTGPTLVGAIHSVP